MPFEYFDIFGKVSASYFVSYCLSVVSITKACRVNAEYNTSTLLVIVHVKCPKMVLGKPMPPPPIKKNGFIVEPTHPEKERFGTLIYRKFSAKTNSDL